MSKTTIKPILKKASKQGYAHGAYNVYALCQIDALISSHEQHNLPLIIQVADPANGFLGGKTDFMSAVTEDRFVGAKRIAEKFNKAASNTNIDVCLHLDHGKSMDAIKNAIDAGFTSVMYDGSHLTYEENVKNTKIAADYAHRHEVSIEAELGVLGGVEDDVKAEKSLFTLPDEALDFVKRTGVDCLAISYGTQHGANKGKDAKLRMDIVRDIKKVFEENNMDCPLVSHGSSNVPADIVAEINKLGGDVQNAHGIAYEELHKAIAEGICKINIDTDIRLATTLEFKRYFAQNSNLSKGMSEVKNILDENPKCIDPRVFLGPVIQKVVTEHPMDDDVKLVNKLMQNAVKTICSRAIPAFAKDK